MLTTFTRTVRRVRDEHGVKKAKTFLTSYLQMLPCSARWLTFVHALYEHHTNDVPPIHMVRSKFLRGYYSKKMSVAQRYRLLTSHYGVVESHFRKTTVRDFLIGKPLSLVSLQGKSGETYDVTIQRHERYRFEGELTLFLTARSDQQMLAALTFNLQFSPRQDVRIRIAALQGPACDDAKQRIVQTTRDLSGARPKALVLDALYGVAGALDVREIEAVSRNDHPLNDINHVLVADNDAFWKESATGLTPAGAFVLPPEPVGRSVEEVAAKKRKEWLMRQAIRMRIRDQAGTQIRAWLRYGQGQTNAEAQQSYLMAAE